MKVNLLDLNAQYENILPEIKQEINNVLDNHQYILGPAVKDFENDMQNYLSVKHAIGCASGTDALQLALMALEIGEGDEVITTPFTFFATASTIYRVGAKPIFVDINPDTFNIDVNKIEQAITPKTKAIMPVHLFGQAAEMDKLMQLAKQHNLKVIEDNAQGIGAKFDNQFAGTIGDIGTLSFFPSKNLGAMGDGGMCLTNSDDLAGKLRQLRVHGESPKYYHKWVGLNSRLDSLQAAILRVKLKHLESWSEGRRQNAKMYYNLLSNVKEIKLPFINEKAKTIYNQFTIVCEKRDELMAFLQSNDIGCAIYYPLPLHLQECFSYLGYNEGDLPVCEKLSKQVLSIPIFGELTKQQIEYVSLKIKEFYQK
ncbi:MAG: DegT/DnrJ/EryC1/StrS family aminotransferase [Candidatus Cloacimonetes bacterium]|nr:DegT/DnrJ/EryC1/StrS family aminotransferase [Candidatus Cloacimonadota bacterium]MDD4156376.1 DegT/DnrJ/EryC1/StrS family aminotransferase [Candidatus Cloacimonadota bacterium]